MKGFLTITEAIELSGRSRSGLYLWIKSKKNYFKTKKVGGMHYIERKSFMRFLDGKAA